MIKKEICSSCGSRSILVFHELSDVPVQSVLLISNKDIATAFPRGDIGLAFCEDCGFIFNKAFDPALLEYSSTYESTQVFSPTFNAFSRHLAERLFNRYGLHDKTVLEIGCGNGEFLSMLCKLGDVQGIGFDPAYRDDRALREERGRVTFIKDYYSEKHTNYHADFICCKMTLEHIYETDKFVGMVRRSIGNRLNTIVFFQIPDVKRILKNCAFEDIYYEHCSYFSAGSLGRLFRKCAFDVKRLENDYNGQYLMIDCLPSDGMPSAPLPEENDLEKLKAHVYSFNQKFKKKKLIWQERLKKIKVDRKRAVLWGSGSKAVSFLTSLDIENEINYAVDINPYRQGTYLAGNGQEIVAPEFLIEYKPDFVIIMNSVYMEEISQNLQEMGLSPEILTLD